LTSLDFPITSVPVYGIDAPVFICSPDPINLTQFWEFPAPWNTTMPSDSNIPPLESVPPLLATTAPPIIGAPPLPGPQSSGGNEFLRVALGLFLALFLVDALASLVDASLILWFKVHLFTPVVGLVALPSMLMTIVVYLLIGLTPMIPKRLFLPLVLFNPVTLLLLLPVMIYRYEWLVPLVWIGSLGQLGLGLAVLRYSQGGFRSPLPLRSGAWLGARAFSWRNLLGFLAVNVFVLLPGVMIYLFGCAAAAADHYSEGFVALRPGGITVQARKYVRDDGKTVQLYPMAHVADSGFYRSLTDAVTTNAVILMEGVSDDQGLLTNRLSYERMAKSLGVAEQEKEFNPPPNQVVPADVDISVFSANTIGILNVIMGIHTEGDVDALFRLMLKPPPAGFEKELLDDLLRKRNRHLVTELQNRFPDANLFVVPWGAAHMPEIAREIEKLGFRLEETKDFTVFSFRSAEKQREPAANNRSSQE
jgi:hypothetical protein